MDLHYEDAPQLVKSSLNSQKGNCLVFTRCVPNFKDKILKYPLALVGNMDETPVFFDMVKKGSKLVTGGTSGCEKKTRHSVSNHSSVRRSRFFI